MRSICSSQLDSKDLRNLPIEERKAKLEDLLRKPPGVIRYSVSFTKDIEELLDRARGLGLEGLIGNAAAPGTRPAVFLGIREDKNANAVVREKAS